LACLKVPQVEIPSPFSSVYLGVEDSEVAVSVLQLDGALEEGEHCSSADPSTN
jgi:hypothetical protein